MATDAKSFVAIAATTSPFQLIGGRYLVTHHINSGSGLTAGLQILSADGTNYLALYTGLAHVNGVQQLDLPPGTYEFVISGSPGAGETWDLCVARVPYGVG